MISLNRLADEPAVVGWPESPARPYDGEMKKTVLDVGNCRGDHVWIATTLRTHFDVEVVRAATATEATSILNSRSIDLVLVNRRIDGDGSEGIDLVRRLKESPQSAAVPVMLISNYPEAQAAAVAAGAEEGFGKDSLESEETIRKLRRFLGH